MGGADGFNCTNHLVERWFETLYVLAKVRLVPWRRGTAEALVEKAIADRCTKNCVITNGRPSLPCETDPEFALPSLIRWVTYRVKNENRKRRPDAWGDEEATFATVIEDPSPGPLDWAISREAKRVIWEALAKLSDVERGAIARVVLDGLTHKDAGTNLRMPLGTVKRVLYRALKKLRAMPEIRRLLDGIN
jgi:RNA polymerase sigma factor (sigma-70 family)